VDIKLKHEHYSQRAIDNLGEKIVPGS